MPSAANLKAWIEAARPRTLPLAVASITMGAFLAAFYNAFNWIIFGLTIFTTVSLQILSNLANDYGDSVHGADHQQRTGPSRMVQSGAISPLTMRKGIWFMTLLTFIWGLILLIYSMGFDHPAFFFFLSLGIFAIAAAIKYTAGSKPYGYKGWGDLSVILFFGLVAVLGSFYLHTLQFVGNNILPALSCGLFATAVLNINNIRDIGSDRQAGKLSIPVRIGKGRAVLYHWALLFSGVASSVAFVWLDYRGPWQWLFMIILPLLVANGRAVTTQEGLQLDPYLKQMALTTLLYVLTFGTGLVMST